MSHFDYRLLIINRIKPNKLFQTLILKGAKLNFRKDKKERKK